MSRYEKNELVLYKSLLARNDLSIKCMKCIRTISVACCDYYFNRLFLIFL